MNALDKGSSGGGRPLRSLLFVLVASVSGAAALAQVVTVPAAHLNHAEGSVAWSPQGDTEWHDVQPRRVLKRGDRLWTDRGSRAEVQAGGHALRLDSQTQLVLENVSENATQLSLTQGSLVLTVTRVNPGDSIELGTPNLAFRARQPGDYRIDVDAKAAVTRVVVLSGAGVVYGEKGEALELRSGQRASFKERGLDRVQQAAFAASDDFDRWAGARRRGEPTVSMPAVAQAPVAPPHTSLINKGPDIIISGPASALPGARKPVTGPVATASPPFQIKGPPVGLPPAKAQAIPNVAVTPVAPAAVPLRVTATAQATALPATPQQAQAQALPQAAIQAQAAAQQAQAAAQAQAQADAKAEAQAAKAQARAQAKAQAQAARAQQQERERVALQQRQDEERKAGAHRAEEERKAAAAKRTEDQRRAIAARKADDERQHAQAKRAEEAKRQAVAKREQEQKRLQARRAEEQKLALQRKAEEKRLAVARAAEAKKVADARRNHLARLQAQAGREEMTVRDALAKREAVAHRVEQERREDLARQEEQARREDSDRRQRQLADQWQRDQERRNQEVWLRQQQPQQPVRPAPMGVPARRVS
jgi:hypothetical protein